MPPKRILKQYSSQKSSQRIPEFQKELLPCQFQPKIKKNQPLK
jgi:hypothetical protein